MRYPLATSLKAMLFLAISSTSLLAAPDKNKTYIDPEVATKEDPDFSIQGEYTGTLKGENGTRKFGVQVIALGGGEFQAVGYVGGLPGDGFNLKDKVTSKGKFENGKVVFPSDHGDGVLANGVITVGGEGTLKRVERNSETLGAKAPKDAIVLFDGSSPDAFKGGKIENGLLCQGVTSHQKFGSHILHLEFRTPYKPYARGQGRGNSGLYMQGRFETQILDSFGLEGKMNECGGIYSIKASDFNMCFPPLSWQTYDVDFTEAEFGDDGKVKKHARMTVKLNGVVIHKDVELPHKTTAAPVGISKEPGPVYLQNHGNPIRFRNIWVVEK